MGNIHSGYRQHVSHFTQSAPSSFLADPNSRLLHFLTALFHEVKDRKHEKREKQARDGYANGYA